MYDRRTTRPHVVHDLIGDRFSGSLPFYTPFWADVKAHLAGELDIQDQTRERIARNGSRARLYPRLTKSFLEMWAEKMRWRNEPFEFVPQSIKAQMVVSKLGAVVKIENTVGIRVWDGSYRVIYPYFSEKPALPEEGARLGFWALREALPDYDPGDFRIVDFHRTTYFRPVEVRMNGAEGELFLQKYDALLREWRKLRDRP